MSPKGPPFNYFDILQQNGRSKNPKGSPFTFFGTMRLTRRQKYSILLSRAGALEENTLTL